MNALGSSAGSATGNVEKMNMKPSPSKKEGEGQSNELELLGLFDLDTAQFVIGEASAIKPEELEDWEKFEKEQTFGTGPSSNQVKHESGRSGRAVLINTRMDGTFPVYGKFAKGELDYVIIKVGCTTFEEVKAADKELKKLSKQKVNPWSWETAMAARHKEMEQALKKVEALLKKQKKKKK